MFKSRGWIGFGALAVTLAAIPAGAAVLGRDAAACAPGAHEPALVVHVSGFKARTGELRVQLYGDKAGDFLAPGKKLRRIEVPVTAAGPMDVCLAVPHPGAYAVAVRHDLDGNGKSGWNDGGGFSRNPALSLFAYKPRFRDVVIRVAGLETVDVVLNYRQGLSIGPLVPIGRN